MKTKTKQTPAYEIQHLRNGPVLARRTENGSLVIVAAFYDDTDLTEQQAIVRCLNSQSALVAAAESAQLLVEYLADTGNADAHESASAIGLALAHARNH